MRVSLATSFHPASANHFLPASCWLTDSFVSFFLSLAVHTTWPVAACCFHPSPPGAAATFAKRAVTAPLRRCLSLSAAMKSVCKLDH